MGKDRSFSRHFRYVSALLLRGRCPGLDLPGRAGAPVGIPTMSLLPFPHAWQGMASEGTTAASIALAWPDPAPPRLWCGELGESGNAQAKIGAGEVGRALLGLLWLRARSPPAGWFGVLPGAGVGRGTERGDLVAGHHGWSPGRWWELWVLQSAAQHQHWAGGGPWAGGGKRKPLASAS